VTTPANHPYRQGYRLFNAMAVLTLVTTLFLLVTIEDIVTPGESSWVIDVLQFAHGVATALISAVALSAITREFAKPCRPVEDDAGLTIVVDHSKVPLIPRALRDERGR
jgi:uncharacterized membrane protein